MRTSISLTSTIRSIIGRASAIALALCITSWDYASAAQLTAVIASTQGPVRIDACTAGFGKDSVAVLPGINYSQEDTAKVGAGYDFTNVGTKAITAIRFQFRERDVFGGGPSYAGFVSDWTGKVDPGQSFKNNRASGFNLGVNISQIVCSVQKVM